MQYPPDDKAQSAFVEPALTFVLASSDLSAAERSTELAEVVRLSSPKSFD